MNPSRREVLIAAGSLVVGYFGETIFGRVSQRVFPSAPEAKDVAVAYIQWGPIAIHRGVHIRTSPQMPDRTRFSQPSNTVNWPTTVNNTDISGDVFVVNNPEIVWGQVTEEDWVLKKSPWLKLRVSLNDGTRDLPVYISLYGARPYVEELASGRIFDPVDQNYVRIGEIGQVFIPHSTDRVAGEIVPRIWSKIVTDKFEGRTPLRSASQIGLEPGVLEDKGERIIRLAQVVASGDSLKEKMQMEANLTPVNVRAYPGKFYANDEEVEVLGAVRQGTRIRNLLVDRRTSAWAACKRGDIMGELYDQNGLPVRIDSNRIVAIYDNNMYLKY